MDTEVTTYQEALDSSDCEKYEEAMDMEMQSLEDHKVWDLVKLPPSKKAVMCKWVYKVKTGGEREVERVKARLVAQGFSQKAGTDYDQNFCPVVRQESFRTLLAIAVEQGRELHHVDVTTAFLNGNLDEQVYMRQPQGYCKKSNEDLVCQLSKSIYGLKQAPRCSLDQQLKMGFTQSTADPCIYTGKSGGENSIIGVYVYDIVLASQSRRRIL